MKQDYLVQLKRGVFIPGARARISIPEKMLLAIHLRGSGYVSADSALSFWGFIPERVYETISMTTSSGMVYRTPIGRFSYIKLPLPYYSYGIQRVELATNQMALIAGSDKALCDKIISTPRLKLRSVKQARGYLTEDLRIDENKLRELDIIKMQDFLKDAPKADSLKVLIKTLQVL